MMLLIMPSHFVIFVGVMEVVVESMSLTNFSSPDAFQVILLKAVEVIGVLFVTKLAAKAVKILKKIH